MYRLLTENFSFSTKIAVKLCERRIASTSGAHTKIQDVHKVKEQESRVQNVGQVIPFARSKTGPFLQQGPALGNQFLEDITLQNYLKRFLPNEVTAVMVIIL